MVSSKKIVLILAGILFLLFAACGSDAEESQSGISPPYEPRSFDDVQPQNVDLELVATPSLPKFPVCNGDPRNVRFTLETKEYEAEIAPGITYPFMSFNGGVPGPAIVVSLGDWVEVMLRNPAESKHAHNVDFHAATGALGGGAVSIVGPGAQITIRFQTVKEGVFLYHCAVAPPVTSGRYVAIVVLPKGGLPDVDKQFYLMEGVFLRETAS